MSTAILILQHHTFNFLGSRPSFYWTCLRPIYRICVANQKLCEKQKECKISDYVTMTGIINSRCMLINLLIKKFDEWNKHIAFICTLIITFERLNSSLITDHVILYFTAFQLIIRKQLFFLGIVFEIFYQRELCYEHPTCLHQM